MSNQIILIFSVSEPGFPSSQLTVERLSCHADFIGQDMSIPLGRKLAAIQSGLGIKPLIRI